MARRIAIGLVLVLLTGVVATGTMADAGSRKKARRLGKFGRPIAEDPKFAKRPPQTPKESVKIPPAVSMAMLPDGRVVYWGGLESLEDGKYPLAADAPNQVRSSRTRILDLRHKRPRWTKPNPEDTGKHDLFCADQRLLRDGRLIAVGGTIWEADPVENPAGEPAGTGELFGSNATRFFKYGRKPGWKMNREFMHYSRWYPTLITLPDGRMLVASGVERLLYNDRGINVHQTEIFDPSTNKWTENGPEGEVSLPLFARLHLMPDGKVFYSGVGQMWGPFGQAYDEALWNTHKAYNPKQNQWADAGMGAYGARSGAFSVMLPLKPPYKEAKILIGGGTLGTSPGSYNATALSEIVTYGEGGASTSQPTSPMVNNRWYSSGVLLPTGEVLAVSGGDKDEVISPASEAPVKQAEIWTGKQWKSAATAGRIRTYHNSAILLPDARVLVGGHAPINDGYGPTGNPEPATGTNNLKDPSFELYKPPYLFRGQRPKITRMQKGIRWRQRFKVGVSRSRDIKRVMLVRLPSTTHITDADMRAVQLRFGRSRARRLRVSAPPSGNVAPPGYYYLFVLRKSKRGLIPSKARIVTVGARAKHGQARAPMGR
jgi:hypothetical protein